LPITVNKDAKGEPEFKFQTLDGDKQERTYRLIQTVIRRIREPGEAPPKSNRAKPSKGKSH
jgi:hypothetical protein